MNKPLKSRQAKVESVPEFGNSLEVEAPAGPHSESSRPEMNSARVADAAEQADEERADEFAEGDDGDEAARLAALPVDDRYEEIKRGEIHIAELQRMTMQQLLAQARKEGLTDYTGLKKQDLIFNILKERTKLNGLMFGDGTLEILPDGFGFLRSPDYHYLPCPDDIYVSPSQIRRFGLRTGATVAGQIRPPKENERYFALLRVEAINYQDPNMLAEKVFFDDLTPLHPENPLTLATGNGLLPHQAVGLPAPPY